MLCSAFGDYVSNFQPNFSTLILFLDTSITSRPKKHNTAPFPTEVIEDKPEEIYTLGKGDFSCCTSFINTEFINNFFLVCADIFV